MVTVARCAKIARQDMLRLVACALLLAGITAPVAAQPAQSSGGVDSDLARPDNGNALPPPLPPTPPEAPYPAAAPQYSRAQPMATSPASSMCGRQNPSGGAYEPDDLIGAAEGVFGSGARGLAGVIRDILRKQGAPNGYIAGREAGGAFAIGLRYGSGTLCQKAQPPLPVFWTGPSIGFDAGANAAKTFVLVYNLNNRDDLFRRFGAGEGQAYFVGGFNVSYLRRGNVVLIPVRLGVGLRLGINGGYMKISRRQNWVPF
jgi:hypothetical protein